MMTRREEWKPVVGWEEAYEVSDCGRVRSLPGGRRAGRVLRPSIDNSGYLRVTLCRKFAVRRCISIHHLVLSAFVGPCPNGETTRHADGNPTNNALSNLRWGTPKANEADKITHGTSNHGKRNGIKILTSADIERIFDLNAKGYSQGKIATRVGAKRRHVNQILSGKRWAHMGATLAADEGEVEPPDGQY